MRDVVTASCFPYHTEHIVSQMTLEFQVQAHIFIDVALPTRKPLSPGKNTA